MASDLAWQGMAQYLVLEKRRSYAYSYCELTGLSLNTQQRFSIAHGTEGRPSVLNLLLELPV